jgi:hypothetical protein
VAREGRVVVIEGEREFVAAIRKVNADLPKHMAKAFKAIAVHVVGVAQQRMPFGHGTAAKSLKPHGTTSGAWISFPKGGPESAHEKAGYYPWLDFGGGKTGVRGISSSEPITHERSASQRFKREPIQKGRYLYPAVAESGSFIADAVDKEMKYLIVAAGFDTEGHLDGA